MTGFPLDPADLELLRKRLAAPTPPELVQWRKSGEGRYKNGQSQSRYLAYIDSRFVTERLHAVVPLHWSLRLEKLPDGADRDGVVEKNYLARITVLGQTYESVGSDATDKGADSDAVKRAGVRIGIAADLYEYEENWVPLGVDPAENYQRILAEKESGRSGETAPGLRAAVGEPLPSPGSSAPATPAAAAPAKRKGKFAPMPCPICKGPMWDNTENKYPGQPDYVCKNRVVCPGKYNLTDEERAISKAEDPEKARAEIAAGKPAQLVDQQDDLPF